MTVQELHDIARDFSISYVGEFGGGTYTHCPWPGCEHSWGHTEDGAAAIDFILHHVRLHDYDLKDI